MVRAWPDRDTCNRRVSRLQSNFLEDEPFGYGSGPGAFMHGPPLGRHASEDRWVGGGSKVGENGVRASVPGGRAAPFFLIILILLFIIYCVFPHVDPREVPDNRVESGLAVSRPGPKTDRRSRCGKSRKLRMIM